MLGVGSIEKQTVKSNLGTIEEQKVDENCPSGAVLVTPAPMYCNIIVCHVTGSYRRLRYQEKTKIVVSMIARGLSDMIAIYRETNN